MRVNYLLAFLFLAFLSVIVIASVDEINLIGCTELNGQGCVCHTVERDYSVNVWVEGPESLYVGQTGIYKMFMAGGPAEGGGYNVAGRFGEMVLVDSFSFQHPLSMNELTQAFSLPFPTPQDTIYWEFGYKVLDSSILSDTIYSCGLSLVWDSIPDFHDRWNFGPKFPITILAATNINDQPNQPDDFMLYQNYPNPFNPSTKISWQSSVGSRQSLKIYNVNGKEVETILDDYKPAGSYEVRFNAEGLPSGIYFYILEAGDFSETKKMILLK
jgi:Secretion system C-terminal sorting domain